MKIGILKETKWPIDNRVALLPGQIVMLEKKHPELKFKVQKSTLRQIPDRMYKWFGIEVTEDLTDCDCLFGVKEVKIEELIPNKHYFFFGHIAKEQSYNKPLMEAMMKKGITFTDYEYLRKEGQRVCAFGWEAGFVGAYNTVRMYGLKYKTFFLPAVHQTWVKTILSLVRPKRERFLKCKPKIIITGGGKASRGAKALIDYLELPEVSKEKFLETRKGCYTVLRHKDLVENELGEYDKEEARLHPERYRSKFERYAKEADILIACHYWDGKSPKYFTREVAKESRIRCVGDVTCDIKGSVETTIRASTHAEPFYDVTQDLEEVEKFKDKENISVMAVDTLPNAIAEEASGDFGYQLLESGLFEEILEKKNSKMLEDATILSGGEITKSFEYLKSNKSNTIKG